MKPVEYDIMFQVEDQHWWYRALRRVLFYNLDRFLPDWRNKRILDAGCGTGANLSALGHRPGAVGLDLSARALEFCHQRNLANLVQGTVCELPFRDDSFDAIVSTSVLYHQWVTNVSRALGEFRRVLAKDGLILIELPAYESLTAPHDEAVMTARRFVRSEVKRLVEGCGFRVLRTSYWNSLLLGPIWLSRRVVHRSHEGSDLKDGEPPNLAINALLNGLMWGEFQLMRAMPLPAGVSISCVAQKR